MCGAEVEIISEQRYWDDIAILTKEISKESYTIGVRGKFGSRQRNVLMGIVLEGFKHIGLDLDLQQEFVLLGNDKDRVLNPFLKYQQFLKDSRYISQIRGIIHGDLHWRNILIDSGKSEAAPWLIDFGHTGLGPIIFDAIELEVDLLVSILPQLQINAGAKPDYQDVLAILEDTKLKRRKNCPRNLTLDKIRLTIGEIRKSIRDYLPWGGDSKDWGAYYIGMCLFSLGLLRHFQNEGRNQDENYLINVRRRICFIIAAKAAEFAQSEEERHYRNFDF